jgi:hypothetical protein
MLLPRLSIRRGGRVETYGMNVIGPPGCLSAYPWWSGFSRHARRVRAEAFA